MGLLSDDSARKNYSRAASNAARLPAVVGDKDKKTSNKNKITVFVGICLLLFYLMVSVMLRLVAPEVSFADTVEQAVNSSAHVFDGYPGTHGSGGLLPNKPAINIQDAGELAGIIKEHPVEISDDTVVLMDERITSQVLDAVAVYNEETKRALTVTYEYQHCTGKVTSFDEITGDVELSDITQTKEVTKEVEMVVPVFEIVPLTEEEIQANREQGFLFSLPYRVECTNVVSKETITQTVTETIPAKKEPRFESLTLQRSDVEADAAHFGEDIFYLRWQPVLILCFMQVQNKIEDIGTYSDGYYLSDEDVQRAIDVFNFRYYFYDDCTIDTGEVFDTGFERIKKKSGAYKLEVSPALTDGVTEFDIRRVPVIAPKYVTNSYLTYEYHYEQLENGYYQLTQRSCKLNPEGFLLACEELVPDFDAELFLEELSLLPGTEEMVAYYENLIHSTEQVYTTKNNAECPSIGTTVSNITGFMTHLYHRNQVSEEIGSDITGEKVPGANLVEHDYGVPPEALDDETFRKIYEAGLYCMDPPTAYVFGSNAGPGISFDCSAFVSYCIRQAGHPVGRLTTISLYAYCTPIEFDELEPGDLIFFQGTYRQGISHVGIWLGNNKYIHESSGAGKVVIAEYEGYLAGKYYGAGRLPALD